MVEAVGYVRKFGKNGIDRPGQIRKIKAFAAAKGLEVRQIFQETDGSLGVELEARSAGEKLLKSVTPGDAILVTSLDRLFVDVSDALKTIRELIDLEIEILPIDMGINVATPPSLLILQAARTAELERHSLRIRRGKSARRTTGSFGGGKAPFGYDNADGRLVENPKQQSMIRKAIELHRRKKMSYRAIANWLNQRPGIYVSHVTVGRWIRAANPA
ncbi:recombinase family protein [Bradyrhizobium sp. 160]|uniref:recombinase family protein n=1 Tax=Bradyrhizobium sp. 160 TaxID=2782634 RepID=UPI001FF80851|nr:recombinase family protein [Bradyrhizobium sp. 160]MCK1625402.1 recombinase family protein [Bradyrhizobium sp. 160]